MPQRICLIHAVQVAIAPIENAFARLWPQAERMNLLEDRLSVDRAREGKISPDMFRRFGVLADYGIAAGASGILYTCSAFGPAIEAVRARVGIPVFKPNEAMFDAGLRLGRRIGLIATFAPSLPPMVDELREMAAARSVEISLVTHCVAQAMDELNAGNAARHHELVAAAVPALGDCDVLLLAQFSMAGARPAVEAVAGCPVLTSPDSAVVAIRAAVERAAP